MRKAHALASFGLLSGVAALATIIAVGDSFGFPGSAAYQAYERFNRSMAVLLALESSSLLALRSQVRSRLTRLDQTLLAIAVVAWIGMAVGTGAEFWLYSDLSYGTDNMRSTAFSLFSMSSLVVGLSLLVLGVRMLRRRQIARYFGAILILFLPLDAVFFVAGSSIFLAPALVSVALGGVILWVVAQRAIPSQDAA